MKEKIHGIVIHALRHSDTFEVLTLYSPDKGRIVTLYRMPLRNSRSAKAIPLTVIEGNLISSPSSSLPKLSGVAVRESFPGILSHPGKNAVSLFILDFLDKFLQNADADRRMYAYIEGSLRLLDRMKEGWPDFHIAFLSSLTSFSGILPDTTSSKEYNIFDLRAGTYVQSPPSHSDFLAGKEARIPYLLSRLNYNNIRLLRLSGQQRSALIDGLLRYYTIHLPGIGKVRSHKILADLFR